MHACVSVSGLFHVGIIVALLLVTSEELLLFLVACTAATAPLAALVEAEARAAEH